MAERTLSLCGWCQRHHRVDWDVNQRSRYSNFRLDSGELTRYPKTAAAETCALQNAPHLTEFYNVRATSQLKKQ